jgi:hypothetical protein
MNKYQRITLVIGAIVLGILLWTTPKLVVYEGRRVKYANAEAAAKYANEFRFKKLEEQSKKGVIDFDILPPFKPFVGEPFRDSNEIAMRIIGALGVTILIFFALKGIKEKSTPLPDAKKSVEKKSE